MPELIAKDTLMLSTREAAQRAGVSIDLITVWRVRGKLPATKVKGLWGFAPADLDATLARLYAGDVRPRWRAAPQRAGARLRTVREVAGLSQRALARTCGLSAKLLIDVERGRQVPLGATIHRLAEALGVAPDVFLSDAPMEEMPTLTTRDVATHLGVQPVRIRLWLAAGVLPGRKVGEHWRIHHQAVREFERSGCTRGTARRIDPRDVSA